MFCLIKNNCFKFLSVPSAILYSASSLAVPPTVSLPSNINLGVTSFYDGLTGDPGWTYQLIGKTTHSTALKDNDSNTAAQFDKSDLDINVIINQIDYKFKPLESGGNFGVGVILPMISISSDVGVIDRPGPNLTDNETDLGDLTLSSYFQFPMTMRDGVPILSHRLAVEVLLPTGGYDDQVDINQSNNSVAIIPNLAFTFFLSERFEVSGRLNYMYNFENSSPNGSAPLDLNGADVTKIQAGQAAWLNFASSYKLTPEFHLGINGYYLKQLTDDKVNGETYSNSKEQVFAIGPGAFWMTSDRKKSIWFNMYQESKVENRFQNKYLAQLRYIQQF